ncbi:MAG TPA: gamma-glutamyltransferase family protein, partial [Longimicrobiaceae bacterium]|nr:gamma-glutamyltransferase family protein [Longimicrobiaceae bacterium]
MRRTSLLLATAALMYVPATVQAQTPVTSPAANSGRSTVYAPNAAIATSQPLATSAGLEIMRRGGNAIDAAVAAAAVLNLTEPHMTGIGGDMFAIVWHEGENRLVGMNAAGPAGSDISREELIRRGHDSMPGNGPEAVTVPGALAGWAALLDRFGKLTLAEVLEPAIRLAEDGFPVSPVIARDWAGQEEKLKRNAGAAHTFLVDGARAPRAGEWFRNPELAASFRMIASEGPSAFYGGALGRKVVDGVRELDGFLTYDDLTKVRVEWVDPVGVRYGDHMLYELPPPGQGVAALQMLRLLEGIDLESLGHNSPEYLHYLIEAKKIAYADLAGHIADPDYMRISVHDLLTDDYTAKRRRLLDPVRAADRVEPGSGFTETETIYLSAADSDGNMISFINSVFGYFGGGVAVPGTGFILQNRGGGFTLEENHPNTVAPGKRPFHTLVPAFATRLTPQGEEPWMAFGVMGGAMQPQGHVQIFLNMVLFGMDPQEANDAARFRHNSGTRVSFEAPIGEEVRAALRARGHDVGEGGDYGGSQIVVKLPRGWAAASDPRKDG